MKSKLRIYSGIVIMALSSIVLFACGGKREAQIANVKEEAGHAEEENVVEITATQYKTIGIQFGSPEMKGVNGLLKVTGFIDVPPQNLMSITTQMGGIVKSTPLLQGSSVRKGQVIAVLQNQDYVQLQQDYLESKSQLELMKAEFERQQTLASENVNSQKIMQQSKSQYQIAQAKESALRQRLQLININPSTLSPGSIRSEINIYAPVTGYVTKVNVNGGKYVNPNDVMFEIVDGSNLHVELNVFEKDAPLVKEGQRVRFRMANDSVEQMARVQLVGREIGPNKTVAVHALASGSKSFIPGTYLSAFIETGTSQQALTLPEAAVVDFSGKKYIFVQTERKEEHGHKENPSTGENPTKQEEQLFYFEMMEVNTGFGDGGVVQVEIPGNPNVTGKVVLNGTYDLLSKLKNSEEHEGH